ncbi:cAMP-dependent protein kinase inhibitor gamma-like isoform X2 [Limulus polyphemus]|uniref:cAMP-dependent protein kinase inhibitor gamma-like isoform X2 n=1 Tax=Limulus polyphemus TaxID=6850 RepID=A0ABM1T1W0_LIMPO|nr:cAMP-dependent protein kinase inhibitor gamma-like isoform X2 [Limulus polyphemus]
MTHAWVGSAKIDYKWSNLMDGKDEDSTRDTENETTLKKFQQCSRTGRRNALPDIRNQQSEGSTASLSNEFSKLSCSDNSDDGTTGKTVSRDASKT